MRNALTTVIGVLLLVFVVFPFFCPCSAQAEREKEKFGVRVIKVRRAEEGCSADVRSDTVFYHVSSVASGDCAFLRAGESYKASLFSGHRGGADPGDHSADIVLLVIEDNKEKGKSSAFNIDSEEVENKK